MHVRPSCQKDRQTTHRSCRHLGHDTGSSTALWVLLSSLDTTPSSTMNAEHLVFGQYIVCFPVFSRSSVWYFSASCSLPESTTCTCAAEISTPQHFRGSIAASFTPARM